MAKVEAAKQTKKRSKKVSLKVRLDGARDVVLTGDFTGWAKDQVRLEKASDGVWSGSVELAPGEYQYRLLVDGEWRDDPSAEQRVPNSYGSSNCVLKVS